MTEERVDSEARAQFNAAWQKFLALLKTHHTTLKLMEIQPHFHDRSFTVRNERVFDANIEGLRQRLKNKIPFGRTTPLWNEEGFPEAFDAIAAELKSTRPPFDPHARKAGHSRATALWTDRDEPVIRSHDFDITWQKLRGFFKANDVKNFDRNLLPGRTLLNRSGVRTAKPEIFDAFISGCRERATEHHINPEQPITFEIKDRPRSRKPDGTPKKTTCTMSLNDILEELRTAYQQSRDTVSIA